MATVIVLGLILMAGIALWFIRRKKLSDSGQTGPAAQPSKRSPEN